MSSASERVCQFFLRGRCQRQNCEFRHPADRAPGAAAAGPVAVKSTAQPEQPPAATEEKTPQDVTEETPMETGEAEASNVEIASEATEAEAAAPDEGENPEIEAAAPAPAEDSAATTEKVVKVKAAVDTSAFIAAAAAATDKQSGTPVLSRRAAKKDEAKTAATAAAEEAAAPSTAEAAASEVKGKKKEIRRNSKGFENFDDYFSDESEDETVDQNTTEEKGDESVKKDKKKSKDGAKEKKAVADLTKDWDEDNEAGEAEETIESIVNFIQDENGPAVSGEKEGSNGSAAASSDAQAETGEKANTGNGEKSKKSKEEWVTFVFGEDGKEIPQEAPKAAEKSVYDLDVDDDEPAVGKGNYSASKGTSQQQKQRKANLAKKDGVTKIGNNMYFYTGPKEADEEEEEEEDEDYEEEIGDGDDDEDYEMEEEEQEAGEGKPAGKKGRSYAHGRRKHSTNYVYGAKSTAAKTRRCGECEGCNREDCAECPACLDKPKFGGKGLKKQACVYRVCTWKNPDGKKSGAGRGAGTPKAAGKTPSATPGSTGRGRGRPRKDATATPVATSAATIEQEKTADEGQTARANVDEITATPTMIKKRPGRRSIPVISPAAVKERPSDKDLPSFDPSQFKPGAPPPVVKKGDAEYHIIVSGVKDTGLCGKYWADMETLPSKRKRVSMAQTPPTQTPSPTPTRGRGRPKLSDSSRKSSTTSDSMPSQQVTAPSAADSDEPAEAAAAAPKASPAKRKAEEEAQQTPKKKKPSSPAAAATTTSVSTAKKTAATKMSNGVHAANNDTSAEVESATESNNGVASTSTATQNRGVSCLSDQSSQKEVVVECFAPYDDHRWVNIGKEKDGMKPDAVQYARALRPPYHLLSFLRIKGHSTKGMSCTDKNTMVFVVLQGEISVVLHTTEFTAKKGDSFYIPPKNYYNLINKQSGEAELSLIQFQYDGPLPSVPAGSQSGAAKAK